MKTGDYHLSLLNSTAPPQYEEDELKPRSRRVSSVLSVLLPENETYGPLVAYCFTVNYILGVGVLGMPYSFYRAGWLLSGITLAIVSVMATFTALWLVEVGRRTAQIATARHLMLNSQMADQQRVRQSLNKCYEMNELVDFHLGLPARRAYEVFIAIYMYGALWSYSSVFATSLASHVPNPFLNGGQTCNVTYDHSSGCNNLYLSYVALVSIICVPLSCFNLTEMKLMQVLLALFRFVSLGAMMATSISGMYSKPVYTETHGNVPPFRVSVTDSPPYLSDISAAVWTGLGVVFPISIYAQIFHHSVPGLSQPLKQKKHLPVVFSSVIATTFFLYCVLGITVGLYFGSAVNSTCTLNWAHYGIENNNVWWAVFLSYLIVLFPPIDIISAFPLNAITLGNNLLACFVTDPTQQQRRTVVVAFRLLAAVPPLIGSMLVHDLASILKYTGCVGVIIAFIYPVAMQQKSNETMRQMVKRREFDNCPWFDTRTVKSLSADDTESHEELMNNNRVLSGKLGHLVNASFIQTIVLVFSVIGLITVIVTSFTNDE